MRVIAWAPELTIGIADMDESHRVMVDAMQHVSQIGDEGFEAAYRSFIACVERDFREEEEVMELFPYPDARTHCEHHARTLSALHHSMGQVMQGDIASGRQALALLFQWFTVHIATMDRGLALARIAP